LRRGLPGRFFFTMSARHVTNIPQTHRALRTFLATCCVALVGLAAAGTGATKEVDARRLFRIERSKNANIVVYDALVTKDGALNSKKPIEAYWIANAKQGQREKLSRIQKRFAYGFKTRVVDDMTVVMTMVADIGREITVGVVGGEPRATTEIDGRVAVLDRIYVKSIEKKLWPSVEYVELFGADSLTGEQRYERIYP
jgi:hypothetical protein